MLNVTSGAVHNAARFGFKVRGAKIELGELLRDQSLTIRFKNLYSGVDSNIAAEFLTSQTLDPSANNWNKKPCVRRRNRPL